MVAKNLAYRARAFWNDIVILEGRNAACYVKGFAIENTMVQREKNVRQQKKCQKIIVTR